MQVMKLNVSEIFYSLQGEGARAGTPNVFIRLQGCKTKHACAAYGVECDTEFESGKEYDINTLEARIKAFNCMNIIWTGGEPLDQLTNEITAYFKAKGYYQAIETSGLKPPVENLDFICVSPKVAEHIVKKNFSKVNELRYVRHKGQEIPQPSVKADYYYISPHSDGFTINGENLKHCIELIKNNPTWRMSVQQHKLWSVL